MKDLENSWIDFFSDWWNSASTTNRVCRTGQVELRNKMLSHHRANMARLFFRKPTRLYGAWSREFVSPDMFFHWPGLASVPATWHFSFASESSSFFLFKITEIGWVRLILKSAQIAKFPVLEREICSGQFSDFRRLHSASSIHHRSKRRKLAKSSSFYWCF